MESEFQDWWDKVAYPQIVNSPASFVLMHHIDEIKNAFKTCWEAAWEASKQYHTDK